MYSYITGEVIDQNKDVLTIVANGLGIDITLIDSTIEGDYCHQRLSLYLEYINNDFVVNRYFGFFASKTRSLFHCLLEIPGVGIKIVSRLLNRFDVEELLTLVKNKDADLLLKVKGIRESLAQTIINAVNKVYFKRTYNETQNNVIICLRELGYSLKTIYLALDAVAPLADLDDYVKQVLIVIGENDHNQRKASRTYESLSS